MPDNRTYYVIADDNCKIESMTKEQILAAITQAVESHSISDVDTGFVTTLKERNAGNGLKFWVGTTAQYNALDPKEENCFYILSDDTELEDLEAEIQSIDTAVQAIQNKAGQLLKDDTTVYSGTSIDVDMIGQNTLNEYKTVCVEIKNIVNVVCTVYQIPEESEPEKWHVKGSTFYEGSDDYEIIYVDLIYNSQTNKITSANIISYTIYDGTITTGLYFNSIYGLV